MYQERMQEIMRRLEVVETLASGQGSTVYLPTTVESIYLQFRNVLELIATASLTVNPNANNLLMKQGVRKWHAGDILEAVKIINSDYYYPKPTRLVAEDAGAFLVGVEGYRGGMKDFKGDYLTREKFASL